MSDVKFQSCQQEYNHRLSRPRFKSQEKGANLSTNVLLPVSKSNEKGGEFTFALTRKRVRVPISVNQVNLEIFFHVCHSSHNFVFCSHVC